MPRENTAIARLLLSNAVWNLARYVVSWIILLVVPPFLIRQLTTDAYATWMLLLQIATYYYAVEVNIQTAVSRFTAQSIARESRQDLIVTLSSIMVFLIGLALVILVLGLLAATMLGRVFPAIPLTLLPAAQLSALMIVGALVLSLPFNSIVGAFLGFQRNRVVTIAIVVSKLASGVAMIVAVNFGGALISLAACFAVTTLLAPMIYLRAWWRFDGAVKISLAAARVRVVREFASYSGAVGFVAMSSILMSGLALPILGIYDFRSVPVYSLALVYGNMLVLQLAVLTVALPMLSGRSIESDPTVMSNVVIRFARFSSLSLVMFTAGLIIVAPVFLRLWVGPVLADQVRLPAMLLLLAQFVVMTAQPYRIAVLGIGQVMKTIPAILLEGATSIVLSLVLVRWWGGTGVAAAVLIASLVGIIFQCLISMSRTTAIASRPLAYVGVSFGRPLLAITPAILVTIVFWHHPLSVGATAGIGSVAIVAALSVIIYTNFTVEERALGYEMALSGVRRLRRRPAPGKGR